MQNPESARIWIYQSNRPFTASEEAVINQLMQDFTAGWNAHGKALKAGYEIKYHLFIVLHADEQVTQASGCSIDKASDLIRSIEAQFNISLFDKFNLAYRLGDEIVSCNRQEFQQAVEEGIISPDTIVYNNMVATLGELNTNWEIPFKASWHARVFA